MDERLKFKLYLQIFADEEKTEEATPRKKEEARKKGQVAKSMELPQIATLVAGIIIIRVLFYYNYRVLTATIKNNLVDIEVGAFTFELFTEVVSKYMIAFIIVVGPILMGVLITGLFFNYIQVGFMFTTEPIKPSLEKINPLKGLKNLFSLKKIFELIKSVIKLLVIGIYTFIVIKINIEDILTIVDKGFMESFALIFGTGYNIVLTISVTLFIIAIVDYFYQRWEFNKNLRMSKKEIKEEFKQTEGDPQIKQKMKQMQQEMLRKRMIQDVPEATVVITNPTHLSVAIKYEQGMTAPLVVAKGADNIAFRIREIAKEHKIPIMENKPLARALYQMVDPGEEIPEQYYRAVAEILQIVFSR